jgi:hypothetical protein
MKHLLVVVLLTVATVANAEFYPTPAGYGLCEAVVIDQVGGPTAKIAVWPPSRGERTFFVRVSSEVRDLIKRNSGDLKGAHGGEYYFCPTTASDGSPRGASVFLLNAEEDMVDFFSGSLLKRIQDGTDVIYNYASGVGGRN